MITVVESKMESVKIIRIFESVNSKFRRSRLCNDSSLLFLACLSSKYGGFVRLSLSLYIHFRVSQFLDFFPIRQISLLILISS